MKNLAKEGAFLKSRVYMTCVYIDYVYDSLIVSIKYKYCLNTV